MSQYKEKANYPDVTLPISNDGKLYLDIKTAKAFGEDLSTSYCFAEPFPHIVIDNFLPQFLIDEISESFPAEKLADDVVHKIGYGGLLKRQIAPESCDHNIRRVFHFFNSAPVLQFLEGLTTIESLIGDPYFIGGGFHETSRGGKLGIHADFRINERLHLNRRVNLLIYLNKDWKSDFGGSLELWDRGMKSMAKSIEPVFNRCVIFNTDADSYHGHPDPLNTPIEITRKSIALYYYTASKKVYDETASHSTMYAARPGDKVNIKIESKVLNLYNYLQDWVPPAIFRRLKKIKKIYTKLK